jgi:hypothetical protein
MSKMKPTYSANEISKENVFRTSEKLPVRLRIKDLRKMSGNIPKQRGKVGNVRQKVVKMGLSFGQQKHLRSSREGTDSRSNNIATHTVQNSVNMAEKRATLSSAKFKPQSPWLISANKTVYPEGVNVGGWRTA